MSKKTIYFLVGGAVVLIAVLIGLSKSGVIGNKDEGKEVETAKVTASTIVETVSATGKIQPEIEVKISPEVSGEIIELPIKEGQQVKKGDLLVKINPDLYTSSYNRSLSNLSGTKSGLSQSDASYKEAKSNYDRNKTLFEKGIISKSDWDKAIASFEVAKANKQTAFFNVQSASATVNEVFASTMMCISFPTVSLTAINLSTSSCAFGLPTLSFTPGQPFFLDSTAPATNSSVVK